MQRQTQLANDLWPLLLPRIQALVSAAASGSGGSAGQAVNLAAHDLGGSLHKGTLRNDQAPQFLLTDGTRSLAGSLAVDAGVTIDGVDIGQEELRRLVVAQRAFMQRATQVVRGEIDRLAGTATAAAGRRGNQRLDARQQQRPQIVG
jgi:hypothetical protein